MTGEFDGRVVLVTGAAGGIGSEVCRRLGSEGATVAAADVDPVALNKIVDELDGAGVRVTGVDLDVSSGATVDRAVDGVERALGPIDGLVNGAGVLSHETVHTLSEQEWAATFAVNATGTFLVSRSVTQPMAARGRGAVVTITSNAGHTPRIGMAAYAASKAAAAMFTKCLGLELAGAGVRCNVVAPGSTDTGMLRDLWAAGEGPATSIEGTPSEYRLGIPLRKIAQPADIAAAVLYLLSDRASHVTMHDLTVDGGATLGV